MTSVRIHRTLAREFGDSFMLNIGNPSDVLQAIDCNRKGFIRRIIQLQKEGFGYDIIVNKTRIREGRQMNAHKNPEVIALVPVIAGSWLEAIVFIFEKLVTVVLFAAISYALSIHCCLFLYGPYSSTKVWHNGLPIAQINTHVSNIF